MKMKCPHCQTAIHVNKFQLGGTHNSDGYWSAYHSECPACEKTTISLSGQNRNWTVYPRPSVRPPAPQEVEEELRELYNEASVIANESPRAAGALLRRALQQLIHNRAGIKRRDLNSEINELAESGKLPSYISDILDSVRVVGNFAAHPIKSTTSGCIIDVEIGEVELCFDVLDALFDFYYVQPTRIAAQKEAINKKLQDAGKPLLN
jgi:hypothetical protein